MDQRPLPRPWGKMPTVLACQAAWRAPVPSAQLGGTPLEHPWEQPRRMPALPIVAAGFPHREPDHTRGSWWVLKQRPNIVVAMGVPTQPTSLTHGPTSALCPEPAPTWALLGHSPSSRTATRSITRRCSHPGDAAGGLLLPYRVLRVNWHAWGAGQRLQQHRWPLAP